MLNLTIPAASAPTAALSPDGQWVAVISDRKILVKGMRESAFRELPSTAGVAALLAWSPDSHEVAFVVDNSIKRVDLVGSRPRSICDRCVQTNSLRGGTWSRDDVLLLSGTPEDARLAGGLLKISANGGAMERVTTLETARGENSHRYPTFLPDGRRFTFTVRRDNGEHEIRVGDLGWCAALHNRLRILEAPHMPTATCCSAGRKPSSRWRSMRPPAGRPAIP